MTNPGCYARRACTSMTIRTASIPSVAALHTFESMAGTTRGSPEPSIPRSGPRGKRLSPGLVYFRHSNRDRTILRLEAELRTNLILTAVILASLLGAAPLQACEKCDTYFSYQSLTWCDYC